MNKTNLLIDLSIFLAFMIGMDPNGTGIPVHEWLSFALIAAAVTHILLHWKWIVSVGAAYFKKLWHTSRLKFAVDVILFTASTALMMSGIMISRSILPTFGIQVPESLTWQAIHSDAANLTILAMAVHIGLNWGWVVTMTKKYLIDPLRRPVASRRQPAAVPVEVSSDQAGSRS